jgi:hypothetical protein
MSEATCEYPGCGRAVLRACDRCRRSFCARHIEQIYPHVAPDRSPWRCTLCTREAKQEARQHTQRSWRGLIWAVALIVAGILVAVVGTALAPDSDEVTFASLVGIGMIGIGAVTALYQLFGGR